MSEIRRGEKTIKHIALLSNNHSYHITLLAKFIEAQLDAKCAFVSSDEKIPSETDLVLLDCFLATVDDLNSILRELSVLSRNFTTALLNAEHNPDHENLLDWPCIYGLFYVDTSEDQLLRGLGQLLDGDYWVPRRLLHHFFNKHRQSANKNGVGPTSSIQLTGREKEILRMIKDGMSNSAVSKSLELSEHTVKSHLYNIYKKIGVRNRMEASNWARDQEDIDAL